MEISDLNFLVVDDHLMIRSLLTKFLGEQNAKSVDTAVDGADGLSKVKNALNLNNPYNAIFLDWNMPKMSGFEMLLECRKDERLKNTAIIMLTAESEEENIIKALSAGATAYIVKPFKEDVVLRRLDNVVNWLNK